MSAVAQTQARARLQVAPCHRRAVERVIEDVSGRLDEHISLRQMASVAYLSPFHFHRIFRLATGVPPGRFLAALRIDEAKRLLVFTDLSVTEISLAVGYHSLSTFSSQFSRLVGLSPRSLRNLARTCASERQADGPGFKLPSPAADKTASAAEGRLLVEGGFTGAAFVGLFPTRIAEGSPVGCTVAAVPGQFRVTTAAEGTFHVLAAALPWDADLRSYLAPNGDALTGQSSHAIVMRPGRTFRGVDVTLGPRMPTDPPILIAPTAILGDC